MGTVNIREAIKPKSDQLNAEQLLVGPMIIKILAVKEGSKDQPVFIHHDQDAQRPYKPCKTMIKVLAAVWGEDDDQWIGQSLELYCDHSVSWAGNAVGGIRISKMTGIKSRVTMSLTTKRGSKKMYEFDPLTLKPQLDPNLADKIDGMIDKESDESKLNKYLSLAKLRVDEGVLLEDEYTLLADKIAGKILNSKEDENNG